MSHDQQPGARCHLPPPLQSAPSAYLPSAVVAAGSIIDQYDPWLEIHTGNLLWNLAQVRARIGDTPLMAVVKCNAYGHGTVGVATILQQHGVQRFAVVKVQEALALRQQGIEGMILNFGPFSPLEAEHIVLNSISQSIFSETVESLSQAAVKHKKAAKVHIKIDTGLSRVGIPYTQALAYIEKVAALPGIVIEGIFTTLAEADEFDYLQIERFNQTCTQAEQKGIVLGIKHAASTNAVANMPVAYLDMVRPGNCLYGFDPLPGMNLKPVMALKTRVIMVKTLQTGDTVAYHRRFKVENEMQLATLPLGYADGYPFQAVNKAQVLIHGQRWPLVVYMSANHVTVDISGSDNIRVGDEVVLFGAQGDETLSIEEVANWADSSVYKVATGMSPFLPRIFVE